MIPTITLGRFLRSEERKHSNTTGELSDLIQSISLGVKLIGQMVSTAGLKGLYGYVGTRNASGESTQLLDSEADQILVELLGSTGHFGLLVSEERDTVIRCEQGGGYSKYVVAFDPLDGSSNIGSNVPVGTIFSIFLKKDPMKESTEEDYFQPGSKLVAAGYSVYGPQTTFVYSCGDGVHRFTLDPTIGEFVITDELVETPEHGAIYSINEGNTAQWLPGTFQFIKTIKERDEKMGTPYSLRYIGSLVADFDRNLKNGGVFLYPGDRKNPRGKLRLLYEVIPLSFIAEQAGGMAFDGEKRILDIVPTSIHERCPFIVGSKRAVEWYMEIAGK